ncbi:MAG: hypothetical protein KC933_25700 [Myxococcales bacterium]|nr:hypothetical protein [Myxococcales bacterium]MCB9651556.1 hypothetical protein [Deltaproteobacteria bacterium]
MQRIGELLKPSVAALSGGAAGDVHQDALSFALRDLAQLARAHPGAVQTALQQNPRVAQALLRATDDRGP